MNIPEQLSLFYRKIREEQGNSRLTPEQALEYINDSRRSEAIECRFYDVKDSIVADGGETYWTMLDSFHGLAEFRDCVTCNGFPVTIKTEAEWATLISGNCPLPAPRARWGMLHGQTFYTYPPANKGDVFTWWGYGIPPELESVSGGDTNLTDAQAELTILNAAMNALEDLGEPVGQVLVDRYKKLKKQLTKRAAPRGPRLEDPPDGN